MSSMRNVPPPGAPKPPTGPVRADLVVFLALLGVAEDVIGRGDLLEPLLGSGVGVGVVLLGQFPVGARDLLVRRRRDDAEHLVVVLLEPFTLCRHGSAHPRTRTIAGAQHLPLPAVAGAQHLLDHRLDHPAVVDLGCATASCTDGSKGTPLWSMRSSPSLARMSMSMAREARSALPSSLTSSDSFRWASAKSSVSSTGNTFSTRPEAARAVWSSC